MLYHPTTSTVAAQRAPSPSWFGSAVLLPVGLYCLLSHDVYTPLDQLSLILQDLGHVLFGPFGELALHLGGPVMQLVVPTLAVAFFAVHGYCFGMQVFLTWLAQNLFHISFHLAEQADWGFLLGELGVLEYELYIGAAFFVLGTLSLLLALCLPALVD